MKQIFFRLDSALKRGEIRLQPKVKYDTLKMLNNETILKEKNIFTIDQGNKYFDLLTFADSFFFAISDKLKKILEENNITGFSTFPIIIENSTELYHGIICKGNAGEIKNLQSINEGISNNREFDINTWDGSDIFNLDKTLLFVCTKKVKEIIEKAKITNIEFKPL